jgi:hypothetical protein
MSPEAISARGLDERSDLYSMGVVLYECLGGRAPFFADQLPALLHQALNEAPAPIAGLASPMAALLSRALAKDPAERPQSAAAFLAELNQAADDAYGADWRTRAGIAALAGTLGVGVVLALDAAHAGAAMVASSGPSIGGGAGGGGGGAHAGTTTLAKGAKGAASHSSRWLPKTLLANKVATAAVSVALVGGVVAGGVVALSHKPARTELNTSYLMAYDNTTHNVHAYGELSHVTETSKGAITGQLTVDAPLEGSGPIVGQVNGSNLTFTVTTTSASFKGTVHSDDTISGTYASGGQVGTWLASVPGGGRTGEAAAKSKEQTSLPTTTLPPTTTTTAVVPLLGASTPTNLPADLAAEFGYGEVKPGAINAGGAEGPLNVVTDITWSSWGGPQATGQGQTIYYSNQNEPISNQPEVAVTVVAFDLGNCDGGPPAYEEVNWYAPQLGQTFDPSQATNACTGGGA